MLRRHRPRNASLTGGVLLFGCMLALALIGLVHPPHNPLAISIAHRFEPPDLRHPMGTDQYGRDILSRILTALGTDFAVATAATALGLAGGAAVGGVAGYFEGWPSELLMRVMDATYAFPHLLLALLIITVMGSGELSAAIAIGLFNVPVFARITFASVVEARTRLYVRAARVMGASRAYVLRRHALGHASAALLVQTTSSFGLAILISASLSFLGLGIQPPHPSLGGMLYDARSYLLEAPWMPIFPGVFIMLAVLGSNLLGDGLEGRVGEGD